MKHPSTFFWCLVWQLTQTNVVTTWMIVRVHEWLTRCHLVDPCLHSMFRSTISNRTACQHHVCMGLVGDCAPLTDAWRVELIPCTSTHMLRHCSTYWKPEEHTLPSLECFHIWLALWLGVGPLETVSCKRGFGLSGCRMTFDLHMLHGFLSLPTKDSPRHHMLCAHQYSDTDAHPIILPLHPLLSLWCSWWCAHGLRSSGHFSYMSTHGKDVPVHYWHFSDKCRIGCILQLMYAWMTPQWLSQCMHLQQSMYRSLCLCAN